MSTAPKDPQVRPSESVSDMIAAANAPAPAPGAAAAADRRHLEHGRDTAKDSMTSGSEQ